MWYIIWIIAECVFWAVVLGWLYYSLIRIAVIGRGLFWPDMRRVDDYFGTYQSWNSWKGYAAYYLLLLMLFVLPVATTLIIWLAYRFV